MIRLLISITIFIFYTALYANSPPPECDQVDAPVATTDTPYDQRYWWLTLVQFFNGGDTKTLPPCNICHEEKAIEVISEQVSLSCCKTRDDNDQKRQRIVTDMFPPIVANDYKVEHPDDNTIPNAPFPVFPSTKTLESYCTTCWLETYKNTNRYTVPEALDKYRDEITMSISDKFIEAAQHPEKWHPQATDIAGKHNPKDKSIERIIASGHIKLNYFQLEKGESSYITVDGLPYYTEHLNVEPIAKKTLEISYYKRDNEPPLAVNIGTHKLKFLAAEGKVTVNLAFLQTNHTDISLHTLGQSAINSASGSTGVITLDSTSTKDSDISNITSPRAIGFTENNGHILLNGKRPPDLKKPYTVEVNRANKAIRGGVRVVTSANGKCNATVKAGRNYKTNSIVYIPEPLSEACTKANSNE